MQIQNNMKIPFKSTDISILYFNDIHGKVENLPSFKTAVDCFDKENNNKTTLKLSGGDINVDTSIETNSFIHQFMNLIKLDASALGNHDIEGGDFFIKAIEKTTPNYKYLASNIDITKKNLLQNHISKSTILERNGEKIGVIGVAPFDYKSLAMLAPFNDYINIHDLDQTVKDISQEVSKLEKQGINKIFLLAHTGEKSPTDVEYYKEFAKIGGIDAIIGGHDHIKVDKWYSSERNEPVKVVSTGKTPEKGFNENLDSFGVLDLSFDDNGVLIPDKSTNTIKETSLYPKSEDISILIEKHFNNSEILTACPKKLHCESKLTQENPVADLAADAMLWVINKETKGQKADIAFVNSGTVRGDNLAENITVGQIKQSLPFTAQTLIKTTLTKKQIMDTLNWCAESTKFNKISPGLMQVSGMQYSIDGNNKVKNVYIVDEENNIKEILDNAPDDKEYTVIYDIFLMTGVAGLKDLKKSPLDKDVEYFPYSRQEAVIKYLKENFKGKDLKINTGRILLEPQKQADKETALTY